MAVTLSYVVKGRFWKTLICFVLRDLKKRRNAMFEMIKGPFHKELETPFIGCRMWYYTMEMCTHVHAAQDSQPMIALCWPHRGDCLGFCHVICKECSLMWINLNSEKQRVTSQYKPLWRYGQLILRWILLFCEIESRWCTTIQRM